MQEGVETVTSPVTAGNRVELQNPFEHATPLGPEHMTTTQLPQTERGATTTMTEHHPYQPQSRQEADLMKVIADAAGSDAKILEAMKMAMPGAVPEAPVTPSQPKVEPTGWKGILYKAGKGAYGVIVAIARALGIRPVNEVT